MPASIRAGDVLAGRYRMVDLLSETEGGWFWCAHDDVLQRQVAVHLIRSGDSREEALMLAARRSAALVDRRNLRVLDTNRTDELCYVVNEWGSGESLDNTLAKEGPLSPRRAAWLVAELADTLSVAHHAGKAHGRLVPENVLVDENGQVRIIGFGVDAALHGLPPDRADDDVHALASVLYAALTGKWPGRHVSRVPAAPREHDRPLRPRQVRAGIPRALDTLCDKVLGAEEAGERAGRIGLPGGLTLGHRAEHDPATAAGIRDALEAFLGDPATGSFTAAGVLPLPVPASGDREVPGASAAPEPPRATSGSGGGSTDIPTEAGMPVFHDDDAEVEWLRARAHKPAPPPAFDTPAERPLFAPEPDDGAPVRRPRAPRPAPDGPGERSWDTSTGTGSGSGFLPAVAPDDLPGRRWFHLGLVVGLAALVLLCIVAAYQLGGGGLGRAGDDPTDEPTAAGSPSPAAPLTDLSATDFDPQGDPAEEYPELAPLVVDGDPATSWYTLRYDQQFGPGGLKSGVGVVVDLGEAKDVARVEVAVLGGETEASVFVTDEPPSEVDGLEPVGSGGSADRITVEPDESATGRYVTVWLTSVPVVDGKFQGEIAEVVVSG